MGEPLRFGTVPVPYTVSWTGEERQFVGYCPWAKMQALCMDVAPGAGKPQFGKPHSNRQREVIALGKCDLCGKPLLGRTKVSLSHARLRTNGATGDAILQVEPLLHKKCAATSMEHCPSLKRDIRDGVVEIRQVTRCRTQFAIMGPEYIKHYVPDYVASIHDRVVGHAKVELLAWVDRDAAWLSSTGDGGRG